jgi:hypothetical protein
MLVYDGENRLRSGWGDSQEWPHFRKDLPGLSTLMTLAPISAKSFVQKLAFSSAKSSIRIPSKDSFLNLSFSSLFGKEECG